MEQLCLEYETCHIQTLLVEGTETLNKNICSLQYSNADSPTDGHGRQHCVQNSSQNLSRHMATSHAASSLSKSDRKKKRSILVCSGVNVQILETANVFVLMIQFLQEEFG